MQKQFQGRAISVETDFVVNMKKKNYKWGAIIVVIIWAVLGAVSGVATMSVLLPLIVSIPLGIIALYLYAVSVRFRPMIVYEYGIEYSSGISRKFDPWGRLMWYREDESGLLLRRVHGIEAAMGLLDNRTDSVTLVTVPFDMPDYSYVVSYILKVLPDAHWNQGTKWKWEGRFVHH